jgi:hypothetical protein
MNHINKKNNTSNVHENLIESFFNNKEHFFFKEVFQIMCFQSSKTHLGYINTLSH